MLSNKGVGTADQWERGTATRQPITRTYYICCPSVVGRSVFAVQAWSNLWDLIWEPPSHYSMRTVASSPDQHNNLYSCEPRVHQWSQSTLSGVLKRKFGTLWKKEQFCVDPLEVIMYDDQPWDLQTIRSFVLAATLHSHSITQKVRIAHILLLIIKPDCQTSSAGQHPGHIALLRVHQF